MNNFLYIVAILLLVIWFIGAFVAVVGKIIHLLLVLAILLIVIRIVRGRRKNNGA